MATERDHILSKNYKGGGKGDGKGAGHSAVRFASYSNCFKCPKNT